MKVKELLKDYKEKHFYNTDLAVLKKVWEEDVIAYKQESFLCVFLIKTARTYKSFIALYEQAHKNMPLTISYTKLISSFRLENFFKLVRDVIIINEKEYNKALKQIMLDKL